MTRWTTYYFPTIFLLIGHFSNGQTTDTLIDGLHYNVIEYYSNGKLKILGQKDSVPNGQWIYFKYNGDTLAKGKFEKGIKVNTWQYVDYKNKKYFLDFGSNLCCKSYTLQTKGNRLYIIDNWFQKSHCKKVYKNGKYVKEYCF